jgi:glycosyltransferase involved in cell wall biosynthesis
MPKVSVIMPVYNGARFLVEAINSLLSQTFTDWELIVIDDGSTDTTPEILSNYQDPRILVFRQDNGGEACARNAGLDKVRGEYVTFLDADDQYLPNALHDFSVFLDENREFDVVFTDGYLCDSNNQPLSRLSEHRPGIFTGFILEHLIINPAVLTVPVCTAFRYSIVKQYDVRFDPQVGYGTDWDFWTQLAVHVKFGYLDVPTCMYRIHETNMTKTATVEKRKSDLVKGRLKVLNAGWFETLPVHTREGFLYYLIIDLLSGFPDKQVEILELPQAKNLSLRSQGRLYRLIGVDLIQKMENRQLAYSFFHKAVQLYPRDFKAQVLLLFARFPLAVILIVIQLWRFIHRVSARVRVKRKQEPKAFPVQFGPVSSK